MATNSDVALHSPPWVTVAWHTRDKVGFLESGHIPNHADARLSLFALEEFEAYVWTVLGCNGTAMACTLHRFDCMGHDSPQGVQGTAPATNLGSDAARDNLEKRQPGECANEEPALDPTSLGIPRALGTAWPGEALGLALPRFRLLLVARHHLLGVGCRGPRPPLELVLARVAAHFVPLCAAAL